MKVLFSLTLFLFGLVINAQNQLKLEILNSYIKDGEFVDIELKNNTKDSYCFIVDTLFYSKDRFTYDGNFHNPIVFLWDNHGKEIPIIKEVKNHGYTNDSIHLLNKEGTNFLSKKSDTLIVDEFKMYYNVYKNGFVSTLNIYKIEPGKSLQLKIPFNLVVKYLKDNVHEYYKINKTKKYKGRIEYLIQRKYIEKYISKKTIDSLENKGYKFFTGKLCSNKVPLISQAGASKK